MTPSIDDDVATIVSLPPVPDEPVIGRTTTAEMPAAMLEDLLVIVRALAEQRRSRGDTGGDRG